MLSAPDVVCTAAREVNLKCKCENDKPKKSQEVTTPAALPTVSTLIQVNHNHTACLECECLCVGAGVGHTSEKTRIKSEKRSGSHFVESVSEVGPGPGPTSLGARRPSAVWDARFNQGLHANLFP